MSDPAAPGPRQYSGASDRGNLAEAINQAISAARTKLQPDQIRFVVKEIHGVNGGSDFCEVHFDNCHFREGIQQIEDKWDTHYFQRFPETLCTV